ncbi:hypothetical protein SNE40_002603 [Patella caerulea]|uniref:Myosin motor domain-containing protein n=1 Tax=Patella caerulea TaxID=87958 RepID=A0AAN8KE55_PATCE
MDKTPKRKLKYAEIFANGENKLKYSQGQIVYVKDNKDVWTPATIQSVNDDRLTLILTSKQVVKCKISDVLLRSETNVGDIETLTSLTPLNEATVLCCVNSRYYNQKFYTSAGSTIIALNPFTDVSHLYTDHVIHSYHSNHDQKLPPHIYEIAQEAYSSLVRELGQINQSIIVSGESGAGKTVSAKHLLRYLTKVSNQRVNEDEDQTGKEEKKRGDVIQNKILDSNPILEAFGNAATPRNANSSRFGKYIKLQFNRGGEIVGGVIQTYLLEKTRTVHHGLSEFNFHIFYQMMKETTDVTPWMSSLQADMKTTKFKNLPSNNKELKETRKLAETLAAMTDIGIIDTLQQQVFQLLCGILYIGNIDFTPVDEESSAVEDTLVTSTAMDKASEQLGLSSDQLEKVFLHRNIQSGSKTRRSVFVKPVSIVDAKNRRDCLIMLLYSRLFEWLVDFINREIQADEYHSTIGLLDIYGFEMFETNSLEQLCINYANEKIQQHYVSHFLKDLQKEYELERIEWCSISYTDNQPCLNILEGKQSIFGVLNEEVYLSRKSNKRILGERLLEIGNGTSSAIKKPRKCSGEPSFIVNHYAGEVRYTVDQLVTKNKDNIPVELISLLKSSNNSFIQALFSTYQTVESPGKKKKTVLAKFKSCLDGLMTSLNRSDVHYIRCIKPNTVSQPGVFDRCYVTQQLRASGILETVEICRQGYSARIIYWEFLQRYGLLIPESSSVPVRESTSSSSENDQSFDMDPLDTLFRKQFDLPNAPKRTPTPKKTLRRRTGTSPGDHARHCCAAILKLVFGGDEMVKFRQQFGKSKLFLHQSQLEKLESTRADVLTRHITVLQWAVRRYLIRKTFHRKYAGKKIWRFWLKYQNRKMAERRNGAASVIQKAYRKWRTIKQIIQNKKAAEQPISTDQKSCYTPHDGSGDFGILVNEHQEEYLTESCERLETCATELTSVRSDIPKHSASDKAPVKTINPTVLKSNQENSPRVTMYPNIPGSTIFPNEDSPRGVTETYKRIMETSLSEDDTENSRPPVKKLKVACHTYKNLKNVSVSDGILTRRRLPKTNLWFHTRTSVLKNAHIAPLTEIQCSITDCLKDKQTNNSSTSNS